MRIWRGLVAMFLVTCGMVMAQTPATALLVLAKKDQALAIVDPATLKVVGKVPVGANPHEVIASADGRTAWVSNYDNGSAHTITVVDVLAQKVVKTIDLGAIWGPHGFFFANSLVWFTAERSKLIGRIDPATEAVDWVLGTGQVGTHMLWVSRDGRKIVTVNVGSGTLSLLTERAVTPESFAPKMLSKHGGTTTRGKGGPIAPDWDEAVVKVGTKPEGFDVLADTEGNPKTIWVANAGEGTVSVVDFATHTLTRTIAAEVPTANRLRFTPDGHTAIVSMQERGFVALLDVASGEVKRKIPVGTGAAGVLIAPDGAKAYVSCSPDNWVTVIDLKTMTAVERYSPGWSRTGWPGRYGVRPTQARAESPTHRSPGLDIPRYNRPCRSSPEPGP
jgi:DNA-binding beta-propeller fold protein YncE